MSKFVYRALNKDGSEISGRHEARSRSVAFDELRERGLFPIDISPAKGASRGLFPRKVTRKLLTQTIRQFATMLSAGVPMLEAIESLTRSDVHPDLSLRAARLRQHLRSGESLASGFAKFYPELPDYVVSLANLGDATGRLPDTLRDAADRMAADDKLGSELRSALAYPMVLAGVGSTIILLMFLFVIPRFGALIGRSGAEIPMVSRMVIETGIWMRSHWLILLLGGVAGVLVLRLLVTRNKGLMRKVVGAFPGIRGILRRADLAVWSRTMSVALANGAPLLTSLDLAQKATRSPLFAAELSGVHRGVRGGEHLDEAFEANVSGADPLLLDFMQTGRKSGSMDKMLKLAAELYEDEMSAATKRLTAVAEPIAILVLSVIVGGLVISIVLAMTSLYQFDI